MREGRRAWLARTVRPARWKAITASMKLVGTHGEAPTAMVFNGKGTG